MSYEQLLLQIDGLDLEHLDMLSLHIKTLRDEKKKRQNLSRFRSMIGKVKLDYGIIEKEREMSMP